MNAGASGGRLTGNDGKVVDRKEPEARGKTQLPWVGSSFREHPFQLAVRKDGVNWQWTVLSLFSTVTDGTNGNMFDLSGAGFDAWNTFTAAKKIVLSADIDDDLVPSNWTISAIDETEEVLFVADAQTKARLFIGKVYFDAGKGKTFQQIEWAQRFCHGFLNGVYVRIFEYAPVHADYVIPE